MERILAMGGAVMCLPMNEESAWGLLVSGAPYGARYMEEGPDICVCLPCFPSRGLGEALGEVGWDMGGLGGGGHSLNVDLWLYISNSQICFCHNIGMRG